MSSTLILLAGTGLPVRADEAPNFDQIIGPFLTKHCVQCHGETKPKGDIALHQFKDEASVLKGRKTWVNVIDQIRAGSMPPKGRPRPEAKEVEALVRAVTEAFDRFDRAAKPDPGRVTMRRLSRNEYVNTIRDLVGVQLIVDDSLFPPDEVGLGFYNLGEFQSISAQHMDRYIQLAELITKSAIVVGKRSDLPPLDDQCWRESDGRGNPRSPRFFPPPPPGNKGNPSFRELKDKEPISARFAFSTGPLQGGMFRLTWQLKSVAAGDEVAKCRILLDGKEVARGDVVASKEWKQYEFFFPIKPGEHTLGIALQNPFTDPTDASKRRELHVHRDKVVLSGPLVPDAQAFLLSAPGDLTGEARSRYVLERFATRAFRRPASKEEVDRLLKLAKQAQTRTRYSLSDAVIDWFQEPKVPKQVVDKLRSLESRGPFDQEELTRQLQEKLGKELFEEHRAAIFEAVETVGTPPKLVVKSVARLSEPRLPKAATNQLRQFVQRGAMDEDTFEQVLADTLGGHWRSHRDTIFAKADKSPEPWEGAMAFAMQAALCSPKFLFRVEVESGTPGQQPQVLDDYALASRLSYFLWSSMPDQELMDLAAKKQLHSNLAAQVKRMLADPRAQQSLYEDFAEPWLGLRQLRNVNPEPKLLTNDPRREAEAAQHFRDVLREDMLTETRMFFQEIVREDRSVLDLIDGKFTYLNLRLAQHYQHAFPGLKNDVFTRVDLEKVPRGGVLTHGSVLTITSMPSRTSVPKRGAWVLERMLGTPPPPPPADVPELGKEKEETANLSLRKRLERHRTDAACAGCHARMDGIGFALENFDAVGRFRVREGKDDKNPIDVTGELPSGVKVEGPAGLKKYLRDQKHMFARCFAEKMLTFAVGRRLDTYDKRSVDGILRSLESNDYRFSALATAIVQSDPFRMRRGKDQR
jgi:mono/diheme cytochrome c family protein